MSYRVVVKRNFSAAHFLKKYKGNCEKLHGHNFVVRVCCEKKRLNDDGMVIDFRILRNRLDRILKDIDHKLLNEIKPFNTLETTSENIAKYIFDRIKKGLTKEIRLCYVSVNETEDSEAIYYE
ncbi:MAG: 6-carboxytetrahydropterin synthase QueD [Candidatus Hydrogenedentota bacterium]